ncbi:two-component regulator propeller domain-containing protein [Pedobacter psychrodurus]|uniref:ligand-binding sensor domain-containing protein n=1 Tax=Pedobacter psychrodurus TaxID=2530456 RepID=UPI00292EE70F|nr:two-component regulator propeller domain-containing protein [Pedobacter psychrodurus]
MLSVNRFLGSCLLKKLCGIFYFIFLCQSASAQSAPSLLFKHLTLEDGLSDPTIRALHTDKDGFLWIGTENGLNRFDGKTCITYKNKTNSDTFPGNYITNIIEDRNGDLIIGSQSNLVKYKRAQNNFSPYHFRKGIKLTDNYYSFPFYIDKQEDLWVYLAGNVYKYNSKDSTTKYITTYSNGYHFSPVPFYNKLDWFISRGVKGIYINKADDVKEQHVQEFFMNSANEKLNSHIEDVYFASDSLLWLASDKGLIKLNIKTKQHECFNSCKTSKSLSVTAIAKYPSKPWLVIGTRSNGLLLFDLETKKFFAEYNHQSDNSFSLSSNYIRKIYIDQKQNLFLGINGYGLDYTNLNKVIFSRYLDKDDVSTNFENDVSVILKPKNGQLWCGTKNSGLLIYHSDLRKPVKHEFLNLGISQLVELDNGNILTGLYNGLFFIYDGQTQKFNSLKIKFSEKLNGKVQINQILKIGTDLFAATEYGIAKVMIRSKNELYFEMDQGINHAVSWPNIQRIILTGANQAIIQTYYTSIYHARLTAGKFILIKEITRSPYGINGSTTIDNTIYLATTSGLLKLNSTTNTIEKSALIDLNCSSALADQNKNLWVATNNGLYYYNTKNGNQTRYTISDGLQSMVFNPNAAVSLKNGLLAFGGINGINVIDPTKSNVYTSRSKPQITDILINDQIHQGLGNPITTQSLKLQHDENTITVAFSTMDFINPMQRKIVYQMIGYDNKKVSVFGSNSIRFPNMPSGKFKLVITDVYSNEKTSLSILISAPFWQKTWFIAVCIVSLIIISLLALFIYLRWVKHLQVVQLRQMINFQKADRKRIADDLHDELGLKLSSLKHYLLAGDINKMIDGGELRKLSTAYIDSSVNLLRNTLINLSPKTLDENGLVTAMEDLIDSINKLGIINIHFDHSGLTVALKSTPEYAIYRICQELINNTIKHASAKNIYIVIINRNERLIFLYEDDGQGYDFHTIKRGYGLFNIEAHTKAIKGELVIDTAIGRGVAVTITINLNRILKPKTND